MKNRLGILYLVIPCYNEQEVLGETSAVLKNKMNALIDQELIDSKSKILFVNDGSKDETWNIISKLHSEDKIFSGLTLSRNRGHQNALMAGLLYAKDHADMVISLDADLQDDVNAIDEMVKKYNDGSDIVYGVRSSREKDTFFKKWSAQGFYKFMDKMGVEIVYNHADFRLMSKRAIDALSKFKEKNLFLRGIVPLIGFNTSEVYYERGERKAGESKYPLKKMLSFAFEGITSFSIKPIRMISVIGLFIFFMSIIMLIISIVKWSNGVTVAGWASLICSIWGIGGVIMLALGVIGEYIGKIYLESKARPSYFVEEVLDEE